MYGRVELPTMISKPPDGCDTIVYPRGELGLRRKTIVNGHHDAVAARTNFAAKRIMRLKVMKAKTATMKKHRDRKGAFAVRGVDTKWHFPASPKDK